MPAEHRSAACAAWVLQGGGSIPVWAVLPLEVAVEFSWDLVELRCCRCCGHLFDGSVCLVTVCSAVLSRACGIWSSVLLKELAAWSLVHVPEAPSPAHPLPAPGSQSLLVV